MADIFNPCQTLVQLTNFLTRPLTRAYPITTIIHLQLALQRHFQASSFFVDSTVPSPFTLLLSRNSLPPTPIFAACLMSGIQWKDWIHLLTRGVHHEICIFVMDGLIQAQAGGPSQSVDGGAKFQGSAVTVWAADSGTASTPMLGLDRSKTERPTVAKLRAVLDSVRSRSRGLGAPASNVAAHKNTITPSIFLSPPTATFSVESTPRAVVSTNDDDAGLSDSDSDLEDSDSDAGSVISSASSRLSAFSSAESVTSIATSVSCASSAKPEIPTISLLTAMANSKHSSPHSVPISSSPSTSSSLVQTGQKPSGQSSQTPDLKTTGSEWDRPNVTVVDHSKNEITRYTYQGGQTGVITGGVMLGTGPKSSLTPSPSAKSPSNSEHASPFKGPGFSFPGAGGRDAGETVTTAKSALLTRGKGSYNAGNGQLKGAKTHKRDSDSADWRSKAQ